MKKILWLPLLCAIPACWGEAPVPPADKSVASKVATSGKTKVPLADVPPEVLAAATTARPGFVPAEAEAETRDGRRYFDVGGKLADGSDVEFDIMQEGGSWRVVEAQRDIALSAAPEPVRQASGGFPATRVIESTQQDGVVIYELYDAAQTKLEIKWDGQRAEMLTKEWAH
jgi:hypothetical protein